MGVFKGSTGSTSPCSTTEATVLPSASRRTCPPWSGRDGVVDSVASATAHSLPTLASAKSRRIINTQSPGATMPPTNRRS